MKTLRDLLPQSPGGVRHAACRSGCKEANVGLGTRPSTHSLSQPPPQPLLSRLGIAHPVSVMIQHGPTSWATMASSTTEQQAWLTCDAAHVGELIGPQGATIRCGRCSCAVQACTREPNRTCRVCAYEAVRDSSALLMGPYSCSHQAPAGGDERADQRGLRPFQALCERAHCGQRGPCSPAGCRAR